MKKIKIGIICPSEIAFRRFLPAIAKCEEAEYAGVAHAAAAEWAAEGTPPAALLKKDGEKALAFQKEAGGRVFPSYGELLRSPEVEAVYIPLPPALHFEWAEKALQEGKHVFLEKPATCSLADTKTLIALARTKGLALHENYMFVYHAQLVRLKELTAAIGKVRLYRIAFGFPRRAADDFRYNKALGGGALLDCGGYTLRLASLLLGESARVCASRLNYEEGCEADLYGSATLENEEGIAAQAAFGMDNAYKCQLEVWGSKAQLTADRVFTPPADLAPKLTIQNNDGIRTIEVEADDQFRNSIGVFEGCMKDKATRENRYSDIQKQSVIVDKLMNWGRNV